MRITCKCLTAILLTVLLLGSALPLAEVYAEEDYDEDYEEDEEDEEDRFLGYTEIATKQDLCNIESNLSGSYVLTADIEFTEKDFEQGGAFYNNGHRWTPIGADERHPFKGVFDGNGHSIKGLRVRLNSSETQYAGFFGYINGGTVENLTLLDCNIETKISSHKDIYNTSTVGSIAGYAENSEIINCRSVGSIKVTVSNEFYNYEDVTAFVGGIVGIGGNSTIRDCGNKCFVSLTYTSKDISPAAYAGGIVGCLNQGCLIERCYNSSNVTVSVSAEEGTPYSYIGGISGYSDGSDMIACRNTGDVSNTTKSDKSFYSYMYAGGIVGRFLNGDIDNCCNTGEIKTVGQQKTENGQMFADAGGIVGVVVDEAEVSNCYNIGNIHAKANYSTRAGGIVSNAGDRESGKILFNCCYNIGKVTAPDGSANKFGAVYGINSKITNCYYAADTGDGKDSYELLKQKDTYIGFDFDSVWKMDPTADYPYPTLISLENVTDHVHEWSGKWSADENYHWHECEAEDDCMIISNSDKNGYGAHIASSDDENCSTPTICTECRQVLGRASEHSFTNDCDTSCNNEGCYFIRTVSHLPEENDGRCTTEVKCSECGETVKPAAEHSYDNEGDSVCNACGFDRSEKQSGSGSEINDPSSSSGSDSKSDQLTMVIIVSVVAAAAVGASVTAVILIKKKR